MTALAKNVQRRSLAGSTRVPLPVKASAIIYVGALVAADSAGLAIAGVTTAGTKIAGIARTGLDNTGGADGVLGSSPARFIEVERGVLYSFVTAGSPLAGAPAYVVDDNTVTSVIGNVVAGVFWEPDPESSSRWFVWIPGLHVPQSAAVADLTFTYTANDPSVTPDGAVTVADGAAISAAETVEWFEELTAKQIAISAALRAVGIMSS